MNDPLIARDPSLSPTQSSILSFIIEHYQEYGMTPTIREIAKHCFISVGSVTYQLNKLEAHGWILRDMGKARSIRILRLPSSSN